MCSVEDTQITPFEKNIYNQYLISSRSSQNKPWRARKDFDTLPEEALISCKKIATKLLKYPHINLKDFFDAPFIVDKGSRVNLAFYATPKAINSYVNYMKHIDEQSPDTEDILLRIQRSFNYISSRCSKRKESISDYFNEKTDSQYTSLIDLKHRLTNIYALLGFNEFDRVLVQCDKDVTKFMMGDNFFDNVGINRSRFLNSKICINFVKKAIIQLKQRDFKL